jgi:hypothetical protein
LATLLSACAGPGPAPAEGTLILGEVYRVLTREQVARGDLAPGEQRDKLAQWVQEAGATVDDIDAGRVVTVRRGIYWNNATSGNRYNIVLMATLDPGLKVEAGNIVEWRVTRNAQAVGQRVRARSFYEGGCHFAEIAPSAAEVAIGVIGLVGPRGVAVLYCSGIENEGWQPVETYWVKPPGATANTTGAAPPQGQKWVPNSYPD